MIEKNDDWATEEMWNIERGRVKNEHEHVVAVAAAAADDDGAKMPNSLPWYRQSQWGACQWPLECMTTVWQQQNKIKSRKKQGHEKTRKKKEDNNRGSVLWTRTVVKMNEIRQSTQRHTQRHLLTILGNTFSGLFSGQESSRTAIVGARGSAFLSWW